MRARTRSTLPPFVLLAGPAAVVAALMSASVASAAPLAPKADTPPAAPQIIMRDGGVCDPIRHMGC